VTASVAQDLKRRDLAVALYNARRDEGDPSFSDLSEWEQRAWIADARAAARRCDPIAKAVAVEMAAQAYATAQGWTWPDLQGVSVPPGGNLELARLEARQKIRFYAKVMVQAFDRHLQDGGSDGQPHLEDRCVADIKAQREHDDARRLQLKPKPLSIVEKAGA
jgi:hypothetical protein